jgi:hypothetical protein
MTNLNTKVTQLDNDVHIQFENFVVDDNYIKKLLPEQADKYTNDVEFLNIIKDRMYAINVTFGNSTSPLSDVSFIGQTLVVLRILYEHFIRSETYDYGKFGYSDISPKAISPKM